MRPPFGTAMNCVAPWFLLHSPRYTFPLAATMMHRLLMYIGCTVSAVHCQPTPSNRFAFAGAFGTVRPVSMYQSEPFV